MIALPAMNHITPVIFCAFLAFTTGGLAHHGNDFFLLEDYEMPPPFSGSASASFDWEKYNGLDAFSTESTFMMTLAPRVALSVSAGGNDEGDGWKYSAVTPRLHFQLTPPDASSWLHVSLSAGRQIVDGAAGHLNQKVSVVSYEKVYEQVPYTIPASAQVVETTQVTETTTTTKTVTTTTTTSSTSGSGGSGSMCDPTVDVDCPTPPPHAGHDGAETSTVTTTQAVTETTTSTPTSTASAGGTTGTRTQVKKVKHVTRVVNDPGIDYSGSIHNHDENLWTGRLVIEADFGRTKAIFNLIGISPEGAAPAWGYAAGVRHQFTHSLALGVEAIGDFAADGMQEAVVGGFYTPAHNVTLRLGAGFGLTRASSDFSLHTGVTWKF